MNKTYTITLSRDEIGIIRSGLFLARNKSEPGSEHRTEIEWLYKKLLDVTATDDYTDAVMEEGAKYGFD